MLDDLSSPADRSRPPLSGGHGPLRVAIVGLGPKGTFALERLLDRAAAAGPELRFEVDAFEPHPVPGAGPVYDPAQPDHLRMNFAAGQVDMWWPGTTAVPRRHRRSFVAWSASSGRPRDPADYPPRAEVGRYLADGLRALLAHAPSNVVVTVRPTRVQEIRAVDGRWRVVADGRPARYDEVLLATGHDRDCAGGLAAGWTSPTPLVPAVFPVDRWLSTSRIAPGATVAIRGFALSFIDAALTLTEGRGGSFAPRSRDEHHRPGKDGRLPPATPRLRYRPASREPAVILPYSRTGRPMLAKPDGGLAATVPGLAAIAERGRRRIAGLGPVVRLRGDLLPILAQTTWANLGAAGADHGSQATIAAWLDRAADADRVEPSADRADAARALAESLAVGGGLARPGLSWAVGQTWRSLYPAVVAGLSGDRLASADWPAFRCLAAELERVSFGPPALNAAKLLALVDAGLVDLTHVDGGRLVTRGRVTSLRSARGEQAVDVVVDAVLAGPGVGPGQNPLLLGLLADGHARVAPGRRGIDVDADGTCRRPDGSPTTGLAALGRPTEDSVIGNDTLSRTLHPLPDRWARRVVARAARRLPEFTVAAVVGARSVG